MQTSPLIRYADKPSYHLPPWGKPLKRPRKKDGESLAVLLLLLFYADYFTSLESIAALSALVALSFGPNEPSGLPEMIPAPFAHLT